MDTFIFLDGGGFLFDMETGLAEEKNQNGWPVLYSTTDTQFYLVTDFLWTENTFLGINRDCSDVDVDCNDDEKVLPPIEISVLSACAISAVGQFCHHTQCGNCGFELKDLNINFFF